MPLDEIGKVKPIYDTNEAIKKLAREECIKVLYILFKNESDLKGNENFEEFRQYIEREIQHAL
jgi:hypothetical protein